MKQPADGKATGATPALARRRAPAGGRPASAPGSAWPAFALGAPARRHDPQEREADHVADRVADQAAGAASGALPAVDARLHTDATAARAAASIGARAFTSGRDVYFAAGQYQPHSREGRHLLAHELTHVSQQARGGPPRVQARLWDDVLDYFNPDPNRACRNGIDEAETWAAAGPYPASPQSVISNVGTGGFDAQYQADPALGNGVLTISQGVAVTFKDTLVVAGGVASPHPDLPATAAIAALATRINTLADPAARTAAVAAYQWTAAEKAPWLAQLESSIEQGWGGQHEFFLNQPRWDWLGASVAVDLSVAERARAATDHLDLETYKTPAGESLRSFAISHEVDSGSTTDAFDQTMRLASTGVDVFGRDLLSSSVEFAHGSAALSPAAQTTLNRFITRFNGATGHAAHQEVRVDLIGHASGAGEEGANQRLSDQRTAAVREYLRANGFANVDTRVVERGRGEREADVTDPNRARDRRVDLLVDGGARQITALHEFGHSFGINDEYGTVGTTPGHDTWARDMTDASGARLPGAVREHNGGVMSLGNEVRARHYANFHHALQTITAKSPWSLGQHKGKWQVQMECGMPSPPGDWNLPSPDRDTRAA